MPLAIIEAIPVLHAFWKLGIRALAASIEIVAPGAKPVALTEGG
jgi:hypothetical protein